MEKDNVYGELLSSVIMTEDSKRLKAVGNRRIGETFFRTAAFRVKTSRIRYFAGGVGHYMTVTRCLPAVCEGKHVITSDSLCSDR